MSNPQVTIVMTPRERFNLTGESYRSLKDNTPEPHRLVIVDAGSPAHVRQMLEQAARADGFTLIRRDYFMALNESRNLGARDIGTPYLVFVDNDVLYTPGWLTALLECAAETDADIIAPLTCIGDPAHTIVHMAGGLTKYGSVDPARGKRTFSSSHRYMDRPLDTVRHKLIRDQVDFAEFHCMFLTTEIFRRAGPLDEKLKTTREHVDFCMTATNLGAKVWFEPSSIVTYYAPPPIDLSDIPFYLTRWNDDWSMESMRHFMEKWDCWFDIEHRRNSWIRKHRALALEPIRSRWAAIIGDRISYAIKRRAEARMIRQARRRRARERDRLGLSEPLGATAPARIARAA